MHAQCSHQVWVLVEHLVVHNIPAKKINYVSINIIDMQYVM